MDVSQPRIQHSDNSSSAEGDLKWQEGWVLSPRSCWHLHEQKLSEGSGVVSCAVWVWKAGETHQGGWEDEQQQNLM